MNTSARTRASALPNTPIITSSASFPLLRRLCGLNRPVGAADRIVLLSVQPVRSLIELVWCTSSSRVWSASDAPQGEQGHE